MTAPKRIIMQAANLAILYPRVPRIQPQSLS